MFSTSTLVLIQKFAKDEHFPQQRSAVSSVRYEMYKKADVVVGRIIFRIGLLHKQKNEWQML